MYIYINNKDIFMWPLAIFKKCASRIPTFKKYYIFVSIGVTVSVISSDTLCKDLNARFTFKGLSDLSDQRTWVFLLQENDLELSVF